MTTSNTEIENIIINFLHEHGENYFSCALATCSNNMPRNTPVDARNDGLTMYFVSDQGQKLENMKKNPNVSIGIFLPYTGWDSAKGAQITGKAKIISRENSTEFKEGLAAYQWEKTAKELGLKTFPETGVELVKVEPEKIEFIDISLKKLGYSPRQTLNVN